MKNFKQFIKESSNSDLKEINELLHDLFNEYKTYGVEYSAKIYAEENGQLLKEFLEIEISSKVEYNNLYFDCFDLSETIDSVKHLISFIYSLNFTLIESNYYNVYRHRVVPYGFIMDPFRKDLDSIYQFLDKIDTNDQDKSEYSSFTLNRLHLNFSR